MRGLLGIDVDDGTLAAWSGWLAPRLQPFFVESAAEWPSAAPDVELTPELRDTFRVWRMDRPLPRVWLDEDTYQSLPRPARPGWYVCRSPTDAAPSRRFAGGLMSSISGPFVSRPTDIGSSGGRRCSMGGQMPSSSAP